MKAMVCRAFGPLDGLVLDQLPEPVAGPGEVVVEVAAAGVNFPDVLMVQGNYQIRPPLPFAPGGEVAGVVTSVGPGVERLCVGDRVMALRTWGGFAERIAVPAGTTVRVPDAMDLVTAAGFTIAYGTAYHALVDRGCLTRGERLLVLGAAGGVGLAAVEIGAALGARIIAAASTPEKLALCRAHGAADVVDYSSGDARGFREAIRAVAPDGVDVVLDPVGGDLSEPVARSLAWDGRLLVVGFASGRIPSIPLNLTLLKGSHVTGVHWGPWMDRYPDRHRANIETLLGLWERGALRPVASGVFDLVDTVAALNELAERRAQGKVVVTVGTAAGAARAARRGSSHEQRARGGRDV